MALKSNPYNVGGVNSPKHSNESAGATVLNQSAACAGTTDNQPNVNPVNPGSHNASGANGSAK